MKLFNKVAAIAVGVMLATGVGAGIVLSNSRETVPVMASSPVTFSPSSCTNMNATEGEQTQTIDDVTLTISKGVNNTQLRIYKSQTATFSVASGYNITSIVFTCTASGTSKYGPGCFASLDGYSYNGTTGTWSGTASSVVFTASSNQVRATQIVVSYSATGANVLTAPSPVFNRAENTITWESVTNATSYQIKVDSGSYATATSGYSVASVSLNDSHTVYVKALADGYTAAEGSVTFHRYATKGTSTDPYTVADARRAIDNNDGVADVYATGIVSAIPTAYSTQYSNITFDFVDEGGTDILEAYRCTGTDAENVAIGDTVVVQGNLTKHNSTYEFGQGCVLISLEHPQGVKHTVSFVNTNGSTSPASEEITEGLPVSAMPSPGTYDNHVFTGWSSDGGTTYYQAGKQSGNINSDTIFTAYWQTKGTESTPYTVGEALTAITNNAGVDGVCVQGIITDHTISSLSNGALTYYISADGTSSDSLEIYKGKGLNNADFTASTDLVAGATVVVYGNLIDYNTTKEFAAGSYLKSYTAPVAVTYTISYLANGGTGTMPDTVGAAPEVAACTFTAPAGKEFVKWNDASDGTGNDYAVGSTVTSNVTLYAIWQNQAVDPSEYFTKITSTSDITDGKYLIVYEDGNLCFDGSSSTLDAVGNSKEITLQNLLTCYFTITDGVVKSASGYYIGQTNDTNGLLSSDSDEYENTVSIDEGENLVIESSGGAYLRYNSASNQIRFRYYKSASYTGQKAIQLYKVNFAKVMLGEIVCNSAGTSQPSGSWSTLESYFNTLSTSEKGSLKSAQANEAGTDIQKAMARYDYIVGKYLKGQGLSTYKDFIGRDPAKIGASRSLNMFNEETGTAATMVVVVVSAVSVTAIGGFFLLKKKPF